MTFPRIRTPNGWTLGSVFMPGEMDQIDTNLSNAVDGAGGGTYAPSTVLTLGGSGVHCTAQLTADDLRATVTNGHTIDVLSGGAIQVEAGGNVNILDGGRIVLNADLGAGGSTLIVGALAFFNHDSVTLVNGTGGHPATWTFGSLSALGINGTVVIGGGAAVTDGGTWTRTAQETWTGGGALVRLTSGAGFQMVGGTTALIGIDTHGPGHILVDGTGTASGSDIRATNGADIRVIGAGGELSVASGADFLVDSASTAVFARNPAFSNDPGADNQLNGANICKMWGFMHTDGAGHIAEDDGYNYTANITADVHVFRITFARPMLNANYSVTRNAHKTADPLTNYTIGVTARATGYVEMEVVSTAIFGTGIDLSNTLVDIDVQIMGRQ